jgi:hypothetical protein
LDPRISSVHHHIGMLEKDRHVGSTDEVMSEIEIGCEDSGSGVRQQCGSYLMFRQGC